MKINTIMAEQTVHQGRNIRRFREMLGWKQDALASALGEQWNQQKISILEQRELIDNGIIGKICCWRKEKAINDLADKMEGYVKEYREKGC